MKLLVVSTWFPWPPDNGSRMRAFHLLREMARRHRVSLLTFSDGDRPDESRMAPLQEFCQSVEVVAARPFRSGGLTHHGLLSPVPRAYAQGFSTDMQSRVDAGLAGHDAAIALQVTSALYFRGVTALPVVFEEAEVAVIRDQFRLGSSVASKVRSGLTWWKYARFVRDLSRRTARTTVVSEVERAILEHIGCDAGRLAVVPNGVDAADLNWPRSGVVDRLIYPGSLTYSANLDAVQWFLDAILPIIRRAKPGVDFWVTGATDGATPAALAPGVRWTLTGHLPDVRPAVAESAVCVVPLRVGGGTRLKILQAMAIGTPVVTTSKGAEGLTVTPGRDILIGDTPEQFASHVIQLLSDRGLRERIAGAARARVGDGCTWTHSAAKLDDVLRESVSEWKAVHA